MNETAGKGKGAAREEGREGNIATKAPRATYHSMGEVGLGLTVSCTV